MIIQWLKMIANIIFFKIHHQKQMFFAIFLSKRSPCFHGNRIFAFQYFLKITKLYYQWKRLK